MWSRLGNGPGPDALFYRDFTDAAPDAVGGGLALISAPPEQFVPEDARGKPACGVIVFYADNHEDGPDAINPLLEWGEPLLRMVQPVPYLALQQLLDAGYPWGIRDYGKVDYICDFSDEAIDVMVKQAALASSPFSAVILCPLGEAVSRMDREAAALNIPDTGWMYFCEANSWNPEEQDAEIVWAKKFLDAMRPWWVDKAPPNSLEPDEGLRRLRQSFGEEKFGRLVGLKDRYDPDNIFSLNTNIPPSNHH
jgi:hypothetical protein